MLTDDKTPYQLKSFDSLRTNLRDKKKVGEKNISIERRIPVNYARMSNYSVP